MIGILASIPVVVAAETTLRMATTAPMGSAWYRLFKKMAREVSEKTGGQVKLKIYGDGLQGTQKKVVTKLKSGKLDAAVLTSEGVREIMKEVMVLQLPLLFASAKELDFVRGKLTDELEKKLLAKGFKLLSWGDAGFGYLVSKAPITTPAGLKGLTVWIEPGDSVTKKLVELGGGTPKEMPMAGVLNGLKDGPLQALVATPLMVVGLQWYTQVKSLAVLPLSAGVGAAVISKASWDKLTAEQQKVVADVYQRWNLKLRAKVLSDNRKSLALLKENGISVTTPAKSAFQSLCNDTTRALSGSLFPASLLARVKQLLVDYRAGKH
ncbi:MAG: TRAP transporter substrate-binding protein DctP [Myxococcales bacterium]|nr:TRAP transporter substrate-binding protein DctP [Myxococcales bacterium]